jgi:ATP-dependent Zn protease
VQEIVEYYLSSKPVSEDVSAELVARKTPGFAGAQIANMINEAALAAAKAGAPSITSAALDEARDKVMMGRERSISRSQVRCRPWVSEQWIKASVIEQGVVGSPLQVIRNT